MLRRAKAREGSHLHLPMHSFRAGADSGEGGGVRNSELGRTGAVRPLWSEADNLRERVAEAEALYGFFSFDTALSQRASHGHLRTSPAARAALIRLCAAHGTRGAVLSARKVETLQRRLRLHLLACMRGALPVYVGAGEADEEAFAVLNRRTAITVHVGPPPRTGTNARWQVADTGEVIRLIHWLADARRRT